MALKIPLTEFSPKVAPWKLRRRNFPQGVRPEKIASTQFFVKGGAENLFKQIFCHGYHPKGAYAPCAHPKLI
jgi:hypothetical protein